MVNGDSLDSETKKLIFVVILFLLIGVIVGVFQDRFKKITAYAVGNQNTLFNVGIDIPSSYREIERGKSLLTTIKLVNLGAEERADVFLDYSIKDDQGRTVLTQSETLAVETQSNIVRSFNLPDNIPNGYYEINAKLRYNEKEATSKSSFKVVKSKALIPNYLYVIFSTFALTILIIFGSKRLKDSIK